MGRTRRLLGLLLRRFGEATGGGALVASLRKLADVLAARLDGGLPSSQVMAQAVDALRKMLSEIDELSLELPSDAQPIGLAARSLVESSLAACERREVDATRLAADMQQVGRLALAMRERLLLAPWDRKTQLPN